MNILVTGASGFVGGPSCQALASRGHDVLALIRRPGSEPPQTTAVPGDLTEAAGLAAALRTSAPDVVLHLAAETGAQRNEAKLRAANVAGIEHLIAACCGASVPPKVVFVSTVVTVSTLLLYRFFQITRQAAVGGLAWWEQSSGSDGSAIDLHSAETDCALQSTFDDSSGKIPPRPR